MQNQKGFTIIELVVVIAIIAVLAGVVLVNVTSYINKSRDAAIKGNFSTIMANGAVFFDTYSYYYNGGVSSDITNFLVNNGYLVPAAAATAASSAAVTSVATSSAFCSCTSMRTNSAKTFCVDSTGYKKETTTACATRCPVGGACVE